MRLFLSEVTDSLNEQNITILHLFLSITVSFIEKKGLCKRIQKKQGNSSKYSTNLEFLCMR